MSGLYLSPNDLSVKNHIALLPCGSLEKSRNVKWTTEELKYYLSYVINGSSLDRMFGGVIFNPIIGREGHFIHPLYTGFGNPVVKRDWQEALDNLFKAGENIPAASLVAFEPVDIWVCLPYPDQSQKSFGEVDGKMLDFRLEEDRYLALSWWIREFLAKWNNHSASLSQLSFKGFVWQREALQAEDISLLKRINSFIHSNNLLSMWLANYGSTGVLDSKDYGFDACSVNPNYYGNSGHDYQWINNTSNFIKYYKMGMQINYGKGMIFSEHHLADYLNLGLPGYNNYLEDCLIVYQFHNITMKEAYINSIVDYIRIYCGIKNIYTKVDYPGISY